MADNRKAGPVTLAIGLIIVGLILLITNIRGYGLITTVVKLWPLLLIGLGGEFFIRSYINKKNSCDDSDTRFHVPTVIVILLLSLMGFLGQQAVGLLKQDEIREFLTEAVAGAKFNYKYDFNSGPIDVKPGAKIRLTGREGEVDLVPSTDGKLYVQADITAWGPSLAEARRRAEMVGINVKQGDVIDISDGTEPGNDIRQKGQIKYRVMIPPGVHVVVDYDFGSIRADKVRANVSIKTESGKVTLSDLTGHVDINSESGHIQCENIDGALEAELNFGDISLKDISKNVSVGSENGRINISSSRPVMANYRVAIQSGDITLRIPQNSDCTVQAKTRTGSISGSLNLKMEPVSGDGEKNGPDQGPGAKGSLVLGSGTAAVNLYSENGNITVDKN